MLGPKRDREIVGQILPESHASSSALEMSGLLERAGFQEGSRGEARNIQLLLHPL